MSRFDVAATFARQPARVAALSNAQARASGANVSDTSSSRGIASGGSASHGLTCFEAIHKLHLITIIFVVLGFILGMVSLTTDYWFVSRLGDQDERNNGLFFECYSDQRGCIETDYRNLYWSVDCHIDGEDIRWTYYVIRGFIFTSICSCIIAGILISVSTKFYLQDGMKGHSIAVIFFMCVPILSWAIAVGRFAHWQHEQLYCGVSFCDMKLSTTVETDCEEGFGYSFSLAVLCLLFHIFGAAFAVARHCFGEWILEEAEGEELQGLHLYGLRCLRASSGQS